MADILWRFADMTPKSFAPGEKLIEEGRETGKLYVLKSGEVEVSRRGFTVASLAEPGAVLGEMSALLDRPHTATVVAITAVEAYGLENGMKFLEERPGLALHVAAGLARRLENTTDLVVRLRHGAVKKKADVSLFERLFGFLTGKPPE